MDAPSSTIGGLLQSLRDETTTLLRQEVALARAEMMEKFRLLGAQAAKVAVGGLIAYAGLIVLLGGIGLLLAAAFERAGLDPVLAAGLAPILVGLAVLVTGAALYASAKKKLQETDLRPEQTVASLKDQKNWTQQKLHSSP